MTLRGTVQVNSKAIGAIAVLQNRSQLVLYLPKEEEPGYPWIFLVSPGYSWLPLDTLITNLFILYLAFLIKPEISFIFHILLCCSFKNPPCIY